MYFDLEIYQVIIVVTLHNIRMDSTVKMNLFIVLSSKKMF